MMNLCFNQNEMNEPNHCHPSLTLTVLVLFFFPLTKFQRHSSLPSMTVQPLGRLTERRKD